MYTCVFIIYIYIYTYVRYLANGWQMTDLDFFLDPTIFFLTSARNHWTRSNMKTSWIGWIKAWCPMDDCPVADWLHQHPSFE